MENGLSVRFRRPDQVLVLEGAAHFAETNGEIPVAADSASLRSSRVSALNKRAWVQTQLYQSEMARAGSATYWRAP
jgi:hypothetical protein